jgi:hypothetical protein
MSGVVKIDVKVEPQQSKADVKAFVIVLATAPVELDANNYVCSIEIDLNGLMLGD